VGTLADQANTPVAEILDGSLDAVAKPDGSSRPPKTDALHTTEVSNLETLHFGSAAAILIGADEIRTRPARRAPPGRILNGELEWRKRSEWVEDFEH